MMPPNEMKFAVSPGTQKFISPEIEILLKQLVAQFNISAELQEHDFSDEQVMFEVEMDGFCYKLTRSKAKLDRPANLSPRELMIASLIAQGLPNKSIAKQLSISPCTVSTHLRRIFVKCGVTSRSAMVARLMQENSLRVHSDLVS